MTQQLPILHLDDDLAVVHKPSGLSVHRGWDRDRDVALQRLRNQLGRHVYPVHRLDRATSGVLLFALHPEAAKTLQESFAEQRVDKRYLLLVRGIPPESGVIDHPVPKTLGGERVPAVTEYRRLATFERYALLEARPLSGRLHQIRRHFKHLSHPLIGDVRYGKGDQNRLFRQRFGLHRLALHAWRLRLPHPRSGAMLDLVAEVPDDLASPWRAMGLRWGEPQRQQGNPEDG